MKKYVLLFMMVALALAIDGTLTRDIFDYRIDTFSEWLGVLLTIIIFAVIALAESTRKNDKQNTSK